MLDRQKKEELVKDLREKINGARAVFLTNVVGLPSNESNALRKKVREADGTIVVVRNTLLERAGQGTAVQELLTNLKGQNALAIAFKDAPGVAKALYEASEDYEFITLEKGFLGDRYLEKSDLVGLAKLPSRDVLLAMTLSTMQAPVSAFVRLLSSIKGQKEEQGEGAGSAQ